MDKGGTRSDRDYDGVIFDMDGVLVEPAERSLMEQAAIHAFESCGVPDPRTEHVESIIFGTDPDTLNQLCTTIEVSQEVFWRTRDEHASEAQIRAVRNGGKPPYDDVEILANLDCPLGVVSSNQQATVDFLLSHYELAAYFEVAYGRAPTLEDLHRKKPNPYFIEQAMADLGVSNPLFVGDRESDVLAARNADVDAAFIRRPHCADVRMSIEPAHELHGLDQLVTLVG